MLVLRGCLASVYLLVTYAKCRAFELRRLGVSYHCTVVQDSWTNCWGSIAPNWFLNIFGRALVRFRAHSKDSESPHRFLRARRQTGEHTMYRITAGLEAQSQSQGNPRDWD